MSRHRPDHHHPPDDSQRAVIHAREHAIRLVAPAGSGKTETLVRRVIERTTTEGVDPRRILMLTFDNNARQALSRLMTAFAPGKGLSRQIAFTTFNSFGNDILKTWFPQEIAQRIVSDTELKTIRRELPPLPILSWDEQRRDPVDTFRAMMEQAICPLERDRGRARDWLRSNYLELPAAGGTLDLSGSDGATLDTQTNAQLDAVFDASLAYEQMLRERNRMNFQDQKLRPLTRLMQSPQIIEQMRTHYDEVIIDEAQDISRLDALLIWCTLGPQTTLTLAGDDDQTIYEFRQASSVFLRDAARYFQREFTTYLLNINYRSPENILAPAQRLIAHNVERIEKGVSSARSTPGDVIVQVASTPAERSNQVVAQVRALEKQGFGWGEIGILVPTNSQQSAFERALYRAGIRTKRNTGENDKGGVIENAVELSTFHRAKGRQWRAVFLPLSSEGEMPTLDDVQQGNLEAERRTFYVSMSRAADVLVVGYLRPANQDADTIDRSLSGEITGTSGASRFLFESGLVIEQVVAEESSATAVVAPTTEEPEATTEPTVVPPATPESAIEPTEPVTPPRSTSTHPRESVADRLRRKDPSTLRNLGRTTPAAPVPAVDAVGPALVADDSPDTPAPESAPGKPTRAERAANRVAAETAAAETGQTLPADILRLVTSAERKHAENDDRYALYDGWDAVHQVLKLLSPRVPPGEGEMVRLIDQFALDHAVQSAWISRLHRWRKARNSAIHDFRFDAPSIADLIAGLRPFMALAGASLYPQPAATPVVSPKPQAETVPNPVTTTETTTIYPIPTLQAYQTARILANGGYDPVKKKTIRTIGIHTLNHGVEFLPLQLAMILLDVKFFIPGEFRYSTSPVFARYCDRKAEVRLHANLRPLVHQPAEVSETVEARIHALMDEVLTMVVEQERFRGKPDALLDVRLRDAIRLANGEANRGVRIEPLASSQGAKWSKS